jgi:hypothetical protein
VNDLSEEQRKEVAAARKVSNQLSSDLTIHRCTIIHRATTLYSLTCPDWKTEHPEADVMKVLASSLSTIFSNDHLALWDLELEMKGFKFARKKWDEDKLEIILERYRDDTMRKLVAEIVSLKDRTKWKAWLEAYVTKGLDLETWKKVRNDWSPREFIGTRRGTDVGQELFKEGG